MALRGCCHESSLGRDFQNLWVEMVWSQGDHGFQNTLLSHSRRFENHIEIMGKHFRCSKLEVTRVRSSCSWHRQHEEYEPFLIKHSKQQKTFLISLTLSLSTKSKHGSGLLAQPHKKERKEIRKGSNCVIKGVVTFHLLTRRDETRAKLGLHFSESFPRLVRRVWNWMTIGQNVNKTALLSSLRFYSIRANERTKEIREASVSKTRPDTRP